MLYLSLLKCLCLHVLVFYSYSSTEDNYTKLHCSSFSKKSNFWSLRRAASWDDEAAFLRAWRWCQGLGCVGWTPAYVLISKSPSLQHRIPTSQCTQRSLLLVTVLQVSCPVPAEVWKCAPSHKNLIWIQVTWDFLLSTPSLLNCPVTPSTHLYS